MSDDTDFSKLRPTDYPILSDLYALLDEEQDNFLADKSNLYTAEILQKLHRSLHSMCVGADSNYFNGHTSGKMMFGYVSPIYYRSEIVKYLFERMGLEIDELKETIPDLHQQLFVQTATWGLKCWEILVGLPVQAEDSYESRRSKVIVKLSQRMPVTKERLEKIASATCESLVSISENIAPYTFQIHIEQASKIFNLKDMLYAVDESKPAHLSYRISAVTQMKDIKLYASAVVLLFMIIDL